MKRDLPRRVYLKHGAYYWVSPAMKWVKLCRESEGLAAMYRALARINEEARVSDRMPAVIGRWLDSKRTAGDWSDGQAADMERAAARISAAFVEFLPADVTTPICAQFLAQFLTKPRTYNLYRSVMRQVLSFAALEGLRDGHNPVDDVPARRLKKRIRIVTPAELEAMARELMAASRGGIQHLRMLALCIKTGQRVSDVLRFRAQDCTKVGIIVDQGKTGEALVVEWDAELEALVEACFEGRDKIGPLLVQSTGKPYTYAGVRSAWVRAMLRAGVSDLHIHDLRGEAGARVTELLGPYFAQMLLGHKSITMTEHYVAGKVRKTAKPAPLNGLADVLKKAK